MGVTKEIFLTSKIIDSSSWQNLIKEISKYEGFFSPWKIIIAIKNNIVSYYIKTKKNIPPSLNKHNDFLFAPAEDIPLPKNTTKGFYVNKMGNIFDYLNDIEIKDKGEALYLEINIFGYFNDKVYKKIDLYVENVGIIYKFLVFAKNIPTLLAVDYSINNRYKPKSIPKYLNITKTIDILTDSKENALLKVNTFPYFDKECYLNVENYDFGVHSLILGSSGCGKSKMISLFIDTIWNNKELKDKYQIVLIDPHAALEDEIGALGKVFDFKSENASTNLFSGGSDLTAETEIYLDIFKDLLSSFYNAKLERVLRYTIYLLLSMNAFNFINIKNLLIELDYRNNMLNEAKGKVSDNIIIFFLNDFNQIKTSSYNEAIAPIISFIDEISMLPAFGKNSNAPAFEEQIKNNFLNIISLDRTFLGNKVTKTISFLVMAKMMSTMQKRVTDKHILFIIDEISTVESPLLCSFLSEARKYNLSLVLAGQYFSQLSRDLKDAIFANTLSYYLFRLSKKDALDVVNNIDIKLEKDDSIEKRAELLSTLPNRTCLARVSKNGKFISPLLGTTQNFISKPRQKEISFFETTPKEKTNFKVTNFSIGSSNNLNDILKKTSTSRKEINHE